MLGRGDGDAYRAESRAPLLSAAIASQYGFLRRSRCEVEVSWCVDAGKGMRGTYGLLSNDEGRGRPDMVVAFDGFSAW
jgi:hypothetical protein